MHTPAENRIGSLVEGANVGPTGGEFLDTSLKPLEPTPQNVAAVSYTHLTLPTIYSV